VVDDMSAKVTLPSRSLLQGMPYTNAASTDLRSKFEALKRAARIQSQSPNVALIRKAQK
jgi:hypothetical protein